jgi:hypothetical protein
LRCERGGLLFGTKAPCGVPAPGHHEQFGAVRFKRFHQGTTGTGYAGSTRIAQFWPGDAPLEWRVLALLRHPMEHRTVARCLEAEGQRAAFVPSSVPFKTGAGPFTPHLSRLAALLCVRAGQGGSGDRGFVLFNRATLAAVDCGKGPQAGYPSPRD